MRCRWFLCLIHRVGLARFFKGLVDMTHQAGRAVPGGFQIDSVAIDFFRVRLELARASLAVVEVAGRHERSISSRPCTTCCHPFFPVAFDGLTGDGCIGLGAGGSVNPT